MIVEPHVSLKVLDLWEWSRLGGERLSLFISFFRRFPLSILHSQGYPREACVVGVGGMRGSLHSLGAVSNTVSFICRLITSMGCRSHPPVVPGRHSSVSLLWTRDVAQGQQAQAVPRAGRGSALTFLRSPFTASPPLWPTHSTSLPNTTCQGY